MTDLVARMGATAPAVASPSERTIEGLAVPFGATGVSEFGALTFAAGAITFGAPGRVKLLFQHDPKISLGYATELTETEQGLYARFAIAEGPEGDKALTEAANGARDGLSVGVMLDDASIDEVMRKMIENDRTPTAAAGRLLEVSQVSLPAFDDARIPSAAAAAAAPVTFSIHVQPQEEPMSTTTAPAEVISAPAEVAPTPTPSPFEAGFQTMSEAPVYTFDGRGPSFVRDMWRMRFEGDTDAAERVQRFNRRWVEREPQQMSRFLSAAVETRTTLPNFINQGYRPDMLVEVIDKGRPLVSRIGTVNLTDATPFRLPVEGDMTGGVGDHTEGTAHVAEGDLAASEVLVTPGAISGAFRLSRELIDSTNPALDQVALRAMMRKYRVATEAKVATALEAADATATASVNTGIEVRGQLNNYFDTQFQEASALAMSPAFFAPLSAEVDTTGRPMLPTVGPQNALGTPNAGFTGANIDGVELFKAWAITAGTGLLYSAEDVLLGESSIQTFRFEEVEGPGVVKLALWSYFCAAVTRLGSVVKLTTA